MHVPADEAVAQGPHGVGQDVPADGLHNVLDEFRTVTFDPTPFLLGVDTHVGDGLPSETVLSDPGLHIGKPASGGQGDEEHSVFHQEADVTNLGLGPHLDRILHGGINRPPVLRDVRVAAAPHIYQRLQLIFGQAHVESAHCFEGTDAAAIAEGQLSDFAFLPEVAVLAVLLDRHTKHSTGAFAVDVTSFVEDLRTPGLTGKVAQNSRLDGTEVTDDEFVSWPRDEGGPD